MRVIILLKSSLKMAESSLKTAESGFDYSMKEVVRYQGNIEKEKKEIKGILEEIYLITKIAEKYK